MIKYFKQIITELWSILKGMKITIKYFFAKPTTVQYPEERIQMTERFRGMVKADTDKCISCLYCVNICPVSCIDLEGEKSDAPAKVMNKEGKAMKRIKTVTKFDVNIAQCIQCGFCAEGCPTAAIYLSKEHENSALSREELIKHYAK
ncbi:MAG: NADH-quinone oxidoreductase subunit I [Planctomycetes bacterium]|nr:NADH-quinone oxidoreductase subunit I [Planctomycetota bacterium]